MLGTAAVKEFRRSFRGELLQPGDDGYELARQVWNAMIDRRPALIARCTEMSDVVAALGLARRNDLEVSVRSGGHSIVGHGVTEGGVMIDLSPLRGIQVDPHARTASVEGGCLWSDVDRETQRFGLATPGGVISHTGVAGLTLGGGYGYLTPLHGLACDNLVSAEVVTANGEVLIASESRNEDLFWGIRGGGGNFGIVTSFEFRLHPVGPEVVTLDFAYSLDAALDVMRAFRDLVPQAPRELMCMATVMTARSSGDLPGHVHGTPVVWTSFVYFGDTDSGVRLVAPVREAGTPLAEFVAQVPYTELQAVGDEISRPGVRRYWKGSFMWDLPDEALETFLRRGATSDDESLPCGGELLALAGAMADVGEDDTAFSHRDLAYDFLTAAAWENEAEDELEIGSARRFWETMAPYSRGGVYVNSLTAEGEQRVKEAYGEAKYERLRALKSEYDPANVFHLNQNITPVTATSA